MSQLRCIFGAVAWGLAVEGPQIQDLRLPIPASSNRVAVAEIAINDTCAPKLP